MALTRWPLDERPSQPTWPWELTRIADTGKPVVDLPIVKQWLRVLDDGEDQILADIVARSTRHVEDTFNRAVLERRWRLTFPKGLPAFCEVELPRPPLCALESVEVYNETTDVWDTVAATVYTQIRSDPHAVLRPKNGQEWPDGPIRFTYTAGESEDTVPDDVKGALLDYASFLYENRGDMDAEAPNLRRKYPGAWLPSL